MSPSFRRIPFRAPRALALAGLAAGMLAGAAPALAQSTITFDGLPGTDGAGVAYVANCYAEGGLTFTIADLACGEPAAFGTWGAESPLFHTGSPALFNNSPASNSVFVNATGGGTFSLFSVDMAPLLGGFGLPTTVQFTGALASGGSVMQEFMVPGGTTTLTTFTFAGFTNLTSFTYTISDPDFEPFVQIDNLRVDVAVIPEPATVLLLGTGLASLGAFGWRRRRQTAA